tara:strand:+ start:90 stop:737 length:648 start_codon:yes stop_codon:yes gene_type:complete
MQNDFIITLAWPEGMVTASGAWYDKILSKNGKYRVGHSAVVLINSETSKSHYFDFGRYHTPQGFGRARDVETDGDLALIDAVIKNGKILNIEELLLTISKIKATHGEGRMYAAVIKGANFQNAFSTAKNIQLEGMLPYGPFVMNGTNCSRFVARVIKSAIPSFIKKLRFKYPFCISPSPKRNVSISNHNYYVIDNTNCIKIKKTKFQAYFTSIEI